MLKYVALVALSVATLTGCASVHSPEAEIRIDSSSPQAAEASYKSMMNARSEADQRKLAVAILMLNMQGVTSARDVVNHPELQAPSIARIRQKVAGMTAEQIMELAAQNPSVRVEASDK